VADVAAHDVAVGHASGVPGVFNLLKQFSKWIFSGFSN
jgi:hypothetical protein